MFQRIVLILGSLVAGYVAYQAFAAPETLLAEVGISTFGPDGRNEIRGQYGGFYSVVTLALLLASFKVLPPRFGLGLLLVIIGGILLGRVSSVLIEGFDVWYEYSSSVKTFFVVDTVLTLLALTGLLISHSGSKSSQSV